MKSFASYHPAVLFIYYVVVIILTMFFVHPVLISLSLFGSLIFFATLITQPKDIARELGFYLLVFLLISITNPIFVHRGETILFFLNDNPVTFEAIIYGFVIGMMLISIAFWSKSYNEIMTSDKFIYLFGKAIPKLSLVTSMILRYVPTFKEQFKKVNQVQKTLGLYTSNSMTDRVLSAVRTFSSLISWSFENGIQQSDSMKARGYGLKGRTNFSLFKRQVRDRVMLSVVLGLFLIIMYGSYKGIFSFVFYPSITELKFSAEYLLQFLIVFILMVLPALTEIKENLQWKYLISKI